MTKSILPCLVLKNQESKNCLNCSKTFYRRKTCAYETWFNQKYCSIKCSSIHRTPARDKKICLQCGSIIEREFGIGAKSWNDKKYCSRICARQSQIKNRDLQWYIRQSKKIQNGCMIWLNGKDSAGYPMSTIEGKRDRVHRIVYSLLYGGIKKGLCVCHKCDNPSCINPLHLFLGTHGDNTKDKVKKGRQAKGFMFPHTIVNNQMICEVSKMLISGKCVKEIAKNYGCGESTIYKIQYNLFGETKKVLSKEEKQRILDLANKGYRQIDIAKECNVSRGHVSHIMIKNGIRRQSCPLERYARER